MLYVNNKLSEVPHQVSVSGKARRKLIVECDELCSLVFSNQNELYVWLALDRKTREVVGCYIGDRSRQSARNLWESLPPAYRQYAIAYTDF